MSRARARSDSLTLPERRSTEPSGCGLLWISAATTAPWSKYTVPPFCRSSDVTRRMPVFCARSSSWKTS